MQKEQMSEKTAALYDVFKKIGLKALERLTKNYGWK